jgi:MoxR-like ATPase
MKAQDLLYTIDDVRRLSDAETKIILPEDIRREAAERKQKLLTGRASVNDDIYMQFKKKFENVKELSEAEKDLDYSNYVDLGELGEAIYQSQFKEVWLIIDEIEKGDEALMTGMLDEIEHLEFTIRETGQKIKGNKKNLRIIITTNTEDSDKIPPSFRRRSLYHFQNYPTREEMSAIVQEYFPNLREDLLDYALDVFYAYHTHKQIQKQPSTPELLSWIKRLMSEDFDELPKDVPFKHILLKYKEDQELNVALHSNTVQSEKSEIRSSEVPLYLQKAFRGQEVVFLSDKFSEYRSQEELEELYASLHNAGVSFCTPEFYRDDDSNGHYFWTCRSEFQIVAP